MRRLNLGALVISLAVSTACTLDKGDDSDGSSGTSQATEPGPTGTGGDPTGDPTGSPTGDPTGDPTGSPTGDSTTTSATDGDPTATDGDLTTSATDGDPTEGAGNLPCIDTPTVLTVDEASALGFSAAQLLADKLGARETSLTFFNEPTTLSEQWKSKVLPLTVELRHEGGQIRFIDSEANPDHDHEGDGGFVDCTDRLEIDVKFDFVTAAGEFDEHHDAVLQATTVERADLRVELLPPGIMGSLDPTSLYSDPEWVVEGVQVGAIWQGELAGGSLLNEVHVVGGVGFGSVAHWGDDELGGGI